MLTTQRDKLELLAEALLEYETLSGEDITELMESGKLDRPDQPSGPARPVGTGSVGVPKAGKRFSGGGEAPQGA